MLLINHNGFARIVRAKWRDNYPGCRCSRHFHGHSWEAWVSRSITLFIFKTKLFSSAYMALCFIEKSCFGTAHHLLVSPSCRYTPIRLRWEPAQSKRTSADADKGEVVSPWFKKEVDGYPYSSIEIWMNMTTSLLLFPKFYSALLFYELEMGLMDTLSCAFCLAIHICPYMSISWPISIYLFIYLNYLRIYIFIYLS